jgi:hypothetical protein
MGWYGLDRSGPGLGQVEGSCERGNEPSGSINCWEVLEVLEVLVLSYIGNYLVRWLLSEIIG